MVPDPALGADARLARVAAVSARSAWAVGATYGTGMGSVSTALILHWNGRAWSRVVSPSLGANSALAGVTAISQTNAWATGVGGGKTSILRWNGIRWNLVPTPSARVGVLPAVTAISARDAWAVGCGTNCGGRGTTPPA